MGSNIYRGVEVEGYEGIVVWVGDDIGRGVEIGDDVGFLDFLE